MIGIVRGSRPSFWKRTVAGAGVLCCAPASGAGRLWGPLSRQRLGSVLGSVNSLRSAQILSTFCPVTTSIHA